MKEYGPFATIVALVTATVAAILAISRAIGATYKGWRPPDEGLPGRLMTGILTVTIGTTIGVYTFINPANKLDFFVVACGLGLVSVALVPVYQRMVGRYLFKKPSKVVHNVVVDYDVIVGGTKLLPKAQKQKEKLGISTQDLLSGTTPTYNPDALWDIDDRLSVQMKMSYLLMGLLWFGLAAVVVFAFVAQVQITNSAPTFSKENLAKLSKDAPTSATTTKKATP